MPKWHSKLSASAASRWMHCPGSIAMSEKVPPSPTSEYAEEGTAAAFLAETCLSNGCDASDYLAHWIRVDGWKCVMRHNKPTTKGFEINDEMVEAVQLFLDTVRAEGEAQAEVKVKMPHVHEVLGGTLDAVVAKSFGKLTLFDLKYGQGVVVEAEGNFQLLMYLLGMEHTDVFTEFEVVIVQPRASHPLGPIRRWTVPRKRLRAFAKEAKQKAIEALGPSGNLAAGDWCRWCPVSGRCPEQLRHSQELAKLDFTPLIDLESPPDNMISDPALLSTERLGEIYYYRDMMTNWFNDIAGQLKERINLGEDVAGYKLVKGVGNRKWKNETKAEKVIRSWKEFNSKDILTEPKLKSPAQIEKLKGKKLTKTGLKVFVNTLTERPEREASLVRDTDSRPSQIPAHAEFEDITDSKEEEDSWLK